MADFCTEEVIGMHVECAKAWIFVCSKRYRVTQIGNQKFVCTRDFVMNRVNLKLDDNSIVIEATWG
jgi:hypothetical protein